MMQYDPNQDQRDMMQTTQHSRSKGSGASKLVTNQKNDDISEVQDDCNMIIWGNWRTHYEDPILLKIDNFEGEELEGKIFKMVSYQDFCIFLTEQGKVYSMGSNDYGMLGLGKGMVNTKNRAHLINIPDLGGEQIIDVKIGKGQVLVLTNEGKVFGWGHNNNGQVGVITPEDLSESMNVSQVGAGGGVKAKDPVPVSKKNVKHVVWNPQLVYPSEEQLKEEDDFDKARKIIVWEDSSFLLTNEGKIYSWGKNEHGFLAREAKIDAKQLAINDKKKKLAFSTHLPGKITKLDRYYINNISIKDGKFYAYFIDQLEEIIDEDDDEFVDDEEYKDVVLDNVKTGAPAGKNLQPAQIQQKRRSSSIGGGLEQDTQINKQNTSQSMTNESKMRQSNMSRMAVARQRQKSDEKKWNFLSEIFKKAMQIKDELLKFDKQLADAVRPLTDIQDRNITYLVLDKYSQGQDKLQNNEELIQAIDRMQVQLKKSVEDLNRYQVKIQDLKGTISKKALLGGDEDVFEDIDILVDLLTESLTMKKFNLVGCKMKVYQERMREINFLELITLFKENDQIDIDKCGGHLQTCKKLCKKIQTSIKKNSDYYLQLHMNCSITSSLALAALTNSIYVQCDIWNGFNTLSTYTYILQGKIQEAEYTNDKIRFLWNQFQILQNTDFNKKVQQNLKNKNNYASSKEWFESIMRDIHYEIKGVINAVRNSMKEDHGENDILYFFQSLVHDAALIRQLLYSAQQALFEGAQVNQSPFAFISSLTKGGPTPGGGSSGTTTGGQDRKKSQLNESQTSSVDESKTKKQ